MAKEKAEVVGVVREWNPQHDTSLTSIHAQIDAWGRRHGERPVRDYTEVEAAVDKLTKRVKTRKVVVHETVTEYVPAEDGEAPAPAPETQASPAEAPKRKGFSWFRRKPKQAEEPTVAAAPEPVPSARPATAVANGAADAWDPGEGRAIEPVKPLQSKAAKRNAAKAKAGKAKKGKKR